MLSVATKSFKHAALKTTAYRSLVAVRSKATLPQLPYGYDVGLVTRFSSHCTH